MLFFESFLLLATAISASKLEVNNYCTESLWVVNANQTTQTPEPWELKTGTAYLKTIEGQGNVLGVSFSSQYYSENTPKFILGSTIDSGRLWYTVADSDGDAFEGQPWNVTSPTSCGNVTNYDQVNYNCEDGDFVLAFNACY